MSADPPGTSETPPPPAKRRRVRGVHVSLAALALVVVAIAGSVAFLLSEAGLPFVVARVIEQSGGRLVVEGPSGALVHAMHFRALEWRGSETTVRAEDVIVEWSPFALFSRRLEIAGLGARRIDIALRPSSAGTTLPESLALPLAVTIANAAAAELTWEAGPRRGRITGLAFGYAGDADRHRVTNLRLVAAIGTLAGEATLGAAPPFPLAGDVALAGDGPLAGANVDARIAGTLASFAVEGRGTLREASATTRVTVTPFAATAVERATATLENVDAASFAATLPHTKARLELDAEPAAGGGVTGTFRASNTDAGPVDTQRVPLADARGRFAFAGETLELDDLVATLDGGAQLRGRGAIDTSARDVPSRWHLAVADLDLARIATTLATTRLAGRLDVDVDGARQTFDGVLAQSGMSVAFAATYADRRVDVTRLRAEASGGVVSGRGRFALDAPRAFDVALDAQRFDPSRFGAWPKGSLSGTIRASGALLPEWRVDATLDVAPGSELAGLAVKGSARGTVTRRTLASATIDATVGTAHVTARGGAGAVGDTLAFGLEVPDLKALAPLAPWPELSRLSGRVQAGGTLRAEPGGVGGDVDLRATSLAYAGLASAATLSVRARVAPGGSAAAPAPIDTRAVHVEAAATRPTVRALALTTARLTADGTLARHTGSLAIVGDGFDLAAAIDGAASAPARDAPWPTRWDGHVASMSNGGDVPFRLEAPATVSFAAGRVSVTGATLAIADGHARIAELAVEEGRISTRGAFDGVPVESLARLAGRPLPLSSTLALSGAWSIAAAPRLNGTFSIRRERGDVFGVQAGTPMQAQLAFGIETLALDGTFADDALDAHLDFASARVGRAHGTLSLGRAPGATPGRIAGAAPLAFSFDADLRSLAPLQPWLGTTAVVNGAFRVALTGSGTLGEPLLAGTITGDDLRIDAPPYGIALRDGRVRAHLADGGIEVDEVSIAGGDGRFVASGSIVSRRLNPERPSTRIAWHAQNFRVTNRPDLRLVVDGDGTLAIVERHLDLAGSVRVVEGHIEWERTPPGQLGPDVVVVGRPRPPPRQEGVGDLPLKLDLDADLGSRLTFNGAGLETGLTGRVRVTTGPQGELLGRGTIVATNGTYFAFGQKLTIDRGRVIFDGPIDNPALDVVALRKNLAVEAGVELTGTVRVPRVRITSNPLVPENEALSWLITGEAPSASNRGGEFAALSAASAALLSSGGKPLTTQIAQGLGLDDISVRSGGLGAAGPVGTTAGQVIVFGKRLTDRLSVGYEQGLTIATNALRIEYALSSTLKLRAEAGTVSGVGIVYRRSFD